MQGPQPPQPDTSNRDNDHDKNQQPEYTKYATVEHFFNEKRRALFESISASRRYAFNFRKRAISTSTGELLCPPPPSVPQRKLSRPRLARIRKKWRRKRSRGSDTDPLYCLRRHQLLAMWNTQPTTVAQWDECDQALPKIRPRLSKFRLREEKIDEPEDVYDDDHGMLRSPHTSKKRKHSRVDDDGVAAEPRAKKLSG
ncbi:hypothetical protein A1O1_00242 [Capronia coronata CBS 617.96]|uniref:Uncharacterized protein n=1 Tax=Capronia coronata CBS 617.96 TaxID=1182541 RepID=W9YRD9_9EURO|nr:uncharacterized protein A1O1_00242 [Capronia coronata CBS 617.96]EXJ95123.1 hypothetical protein A1O1_00242 [Capronia coronata CBS 617.96]